MASREPLWVDVGGALLGLTLVLSGLTSRPTIGYLPGDVRGTPEYNLIVTVLFVGLGTLFVAGFGVRLIRGMRGRR